jgi:predicted transcriptional regulator of viral defense system
MGDTAHTPDRKDLFAVASQQGGYFTAEQARRCGYTWALLSHHALGGRFVRIRRGLYRLKEYPSSPREDVLAGWLAVGRDAAVVSHESALELLGLSDVVPDRVHLTVSRSHRGRKAPAGVRMHTTTQRLRREDIIIRDGIRLTSPARSIIDAASTGVAPEQVASAAREAVARGLVTKRVLEKAARAQGKRVGRLVEEALLEVAVP